MFSAKSTILPLVARRLFRLAGSPKAEAGVVDDTGDVHTPSMTLKNAALLALIGTILMTALGLQLRATTPNSTLAGLYT